MDVKQPRYDVGVMVARFQVPSLTEAHKDLIQSVIDRHESVIIFLGVSPLRATQNNPLDFSSRRQMVLSEFPDANIDVLFVKDIADDELWSKRLDAQISSIVSPTHSVALYGGRDSFIERYHGTYPTIELDNDRYISGTVIRTKTSKRTISSPDFRAGVIYAATNNFAKAITTVDIAIFNEDYTEILLGRKPDEDKYRLIGGFSSPESASYELDAIREVYEETNLSVGPPSNLDYLGSFRIDDWRYRGEADQIKTLLFATRRLMGGPRPGDDIHELRWFKVNEFIGPHSLMVDQSMLNRTVVPQHHEILTKSLVYATKKQARKDN